VFIRLTSDPLSDSEVVSSLIFFALLFNCDLLLFGIYGVVPIIKKKSKG